MKKCDYCTSDIQSAAKICSICNRVQNEYLEEITKVSKSLELIRKSVFEADTKGPTQQRYRIHHRISGSGSGDAVLSDPV